MQNETLDAQLKALNDSFRKYIESVSASDNTLVNPWTRAVEDYLMYVRVLKETYSAHDGILLSWGTGDCGQLGHGQDANEMWIENKRPKVIKGLPKRLAQVAAGGIHNVTLSTSGEVHTWGVNDDYALGRTGVEHNPLPVAFVNANPYAGKIMIAKVGAGDCHSLALTTDGRIFGWGAFRDKDGKKFYPNDDGKKSFKYTQKTPREMVKFSAMSGKAVVDIVCGSCFNYARLRNGALYSWGIGENGELGRKVCEMQETIDGELEYKKDGIYRTHLTPNTVQYKDPKTGAVATVEYAKAIGCGAYHALFTVSSKKHGSQVYATGMNNYGQLGIKDPDSKKEKWRNIPELVSELSPYNVAMIQAGEHHSVVLDASGRVYSFGRGDSGQLGRKGPDDSKGRVSEGYFDPIPGRVGKAMVGHAIKQISCGSNHTLALSIENNIFAWGYGDNGSLGQGKEEDSLFPIQLREKELKKGQGHQVVQVEAGGQHSCAIIMDEPSSKKRKSMF